MHRREFLRQALRDSPLLPAPMCNYSDRPFRDLMRHMGAHLVCTEMYSSEAMARGDPKTERLMDYRGGELLVVVQVFGKRPDLMAESARIAVRLGASVVDINMGCPAKKITKTGCGAAMAEDLPTATAVIRAVRGAVDVPVTVKTRWLTGGQTLELLRICEDEGVDAIALHARTRAQGYSGTANWEWIARLKERARTPVIGNGDVFSAADAWRMRAETNCDAVMAGRGLVGNPWLMRDAAELWRRERAGEAIDPNAEAPRQPSFEERLDILLKHARLMFEHKGPHGLIEFRKHCAGYIRGLPNARVARLELMQITALEELHEKIEKFFGHIRERGPRSF